MKAIRLMAIALLTSLAAILVFSSAAGHRLEHESPTVIFDYDVTNDYGILFADEFERLGGAEALGYPASYRFRLDDGFVYQVTQGALLQWRPESTQGLFGQHLRDAGKSRLRPMASRHEGYPIADQRRWVRWGLE